MTQKDLAHASGISGVFLGTVERGEKAATVETVEKLARGLAVPPADLFRFEAPTKEAGGFERLTRKLAGLARGASERKLERFERIARVFFEED